jgi:hypothetical protein
MNYKDTKQRNQTDKWLKQNGINVAHIYVGTDELFQATKLATTTLRDFGRLLEQNQAQTLNTFLWATRSIKTREKITQGQCFNVLNIAKQIQRKSAKSQKAIRRSIKKLRK